MAEYSGRDKRLAYLFDAVENVQVDDMTGASASTDGAHGLVPAPLAGDEDKYLKGDGSWAAVQAGAGALSGLSDVDLSSPTDGQALVYDGTNSKWINGNVGGGGSGGGSVNTDIAKKYSVTLTSSEYGWFTFVDEDGNTLRPKDGIPLFALALVDNNQYFTGLFWQSGNEETGSYIFKVGNVNNTPLPIRTSSSTLTFYLAYMPYKVTVPQTALIYSTEEREVGVWTDGKPLYQKTFYLASCSGVEDPLVADLSSLSIDTIIGGSGMCLNASNYVIPVNYAHQNSGYDVTWLVNDLKTRLELRLGSGQRTLHDIYITLHYTKTTDTAGSGIWTTTGEYAHHYSTSEKVIGTWIDGKPVYEITYELDTPLTISGVSYIHSGITPTNIKSLIGTPEAIDTYGQSAPILAGLYSSGELALAAVNNQYSIVLKYLIIRYTKTTD